MKQAEAMLAIYHTDTPTPREIAEFWDEDTKKTSRVMTNLWREGLVMRRRRPGTKSYEYTLADPDVARNTPRKVQSEGGAE